MTDDELALQRHLDEELNQFQPGPIRAEAVYGRARAIRHTRRVWAAGALVTVAVLGTSLPVLGSIGLRQNPAGGGKPATSGNTVTVNAPHTDNKGRYVFSGSEEGKAWSVTVAPGDCLPAADFPKACDGGPGDNPGQFSYTASFGSPAKYAVFFRPEVARIDLGLSDGEQVTLLPGIVHGHLVALLVVPSKIGITRVDAYGADGRLAYSMPFH